MIKQKMSHRIQTRKLALSNVFQNTIFKCRQTLTIARRRSWGRKHLKELNNTSSSSENDLSKYLAQINVI